MTSYYKNLIKQVENGTSPIVLVNVCTHGDELIGLKTIKELKKLKIKNGTLLFCVANERALKQKVRFIDKDLNRVFPGKQKGVYEERLAYDINLIAQKVDVFLDIHSTKTGSPKSLIVEKLNKATLNAIKTIHPKRVIHMNNPKKNSTISNTKIGIGFEYGSDNKVTTSAVVTDITRLLRSLHMIAGKSRVRKKKIEVYENTKPVPRLDGYEVRNGVRNFTLVAKSAAYAVKGNEVIFAKKDMYPILFGKKNNYKDILGFAASKLNLLEEQKEKGHRKNLRP